MWRWLRRPQKQTALLRRIVDRVRNSLEPKVVLQTAVAEIGTLLNLDRCQFFWYFHDTRRIQIVCEYPPPTVSNPSSLGYCPVELFGAAAEMVSRGQLIVNSGIGWGRRRSLRNWFATLRGQPKSSSPIFGAAANLLVPVNGEDGAIGFIACLSDRVRNWSTAEIELLQAIAQQLEIAIRQAQLYEQTQKQAQRERLVNQITTQTRQSFELEEILRGAIAQLLKALAVDRCLVHLVEESSLNSSADLFEQHLYEVCRSPFPSTVNEFDLTGPITQWVIQTRRRVAIADVSQDDRIGANNPEYCKAQIKSSLVVPVQTKDTLYAILYLNQCSQVRYWSKNDQTLTQAVADQLAISIQQAHLYAQTQQQAIASAAQAEHLARTLQELRLTQAQLIQSEKMSSLGRMVAGVAHEINNPANFIYGNLPYVESHVQDVLRLLRAYQMRYPTDAELQALLAEIDLEFVLADLPRILGSLRSGTERIREVVRSLRNFSRLDEAQLKTVNLQEGLESTLLVLQTYLRDIEIIRHYGELCPVECYPSQLNQVFLAILLNAIEALHHWPGRKTIALYTDRIPASTTQPERVRVAISDSGPGIPHTIQSKIFDPFFTTKDVGQGVGLGLTVSYQTVVNQHRGHLKVYSEPGQGTEFLIEIPVSHSRLQRQEPPLLIQ